MQGKQGDGESAGFNRVLVMVSWKSDLQADTWRREGGSHVDIQGRGLGPEEEQVQEVLRQGAARCLQGPARKLRSRQGGRRGVGGRRWGAPRSRGGSHRSSVRLPVLLSDEKPESWELA